MIKDSVSISFAPNVNITDEKFIREYIIPALTALKQGVNGNEICNISIECSHIDSERQQT